MVTYPSTHGVYEDDITELCEIVHEHGGQVYVDGANLNALLGFAKPGEFGGDVSHLNLHKTFCIPHGGGGPGVGPVAVRAHLAPYLPNHPMHPEAERARGHRPDQRRAVRLGRDPADLVGLHPDDGRRRPDPRDRGRGAVGQLRRAPAARALPGALHAATTAWSRTSASSTCARSPRPTGVTVDDVAKRLIDYGFHAPTMSFPVAGTLMVEPTESRGPRRARPVLRRDDRDPRARSTGWRRGSGRPRTSPLRDAPHTARRSPASGTAPYSREHGGVPGRARPGQVLAAGRPHRPGVRRPQPGLRLPAAGGVRGVTGMRDLPAPGRRFDALLAAAQRTGRLPSMTAGLVRARSTGSHKRRPGVVRSTGDAVRADRRAGRHAVPDRLDHQDVHRGAGAAGCATRACSRSTTRWRRTSPTSPYGDRPLRALLSHAAGIQAEPVGPWWERSTGGDFAALVEANRDQRRALRSQTPTTYYSNLGFGAAGRGGGAGAEARTGGRRRAVPDPRPARDGPHDLPGDPGRTRRGYSVSHLLGTLTPEPHSRHRRDGAGRADVEHGDRPRDIRGLRAARP